MSAERFRRFFPNRVSLQKIPSEPTLEEVEKPQAVTTIHLPQPDFTLANKLLQQINETTPPQLRLFLDDNNPNWFDQDIESSEMAVRGIVRHVALLNHGFKHPNGWSQYRDDEGKEFRFYDFEGRALIGRDEKNQIIFKGELEKCPAGKKVSDFLANATKFGLDWGNVAFWNLGSLQTLMSVADSHTYLELLPPGVFLFEDELKDLHRGGSVRAMFKTGLGMGFIVTELDAYKVIDGQLYRVTASYID